MTFAAPYRIETRIDERRWTAVDEQGRPALVFELAASGTSSPRRLANIWYSPPEPMELLAEGTTRVLSAAVLVCRSDDRLMRDHFWRLSESIFGREPRAITSEDDIEQRLDAFIRLFASLRAPPRRTAQGLWAELAILAWSEDVVVATDSWHTTPRDLHDFVGSSEVFELKSTTREERRHEISLDQLDAPGGKRILLGSMLVEEHEDGTSVRDLAGRLLVRLQHAPEQSRKVERIVYESLGREWAQGTSVRCREREAWRSLRLFRGEDVPRVQGPIPAEVSNVRFLVSLDGLDHIETDTARRWSNWWRAILPGEEWLPK